MITSTQIRKTEIFAFTAVLVFKLLSVKNLLNNRKDNKNCKKVGYFLLSKKIASSIGKLLQNYK